LNSLKRIITKKCNILIPNPYSKIIGYSCWRENNMLQRRMSSTFSPSLRADV